MLPEEFQLPEYRSDIDTDEPPDNVVDITEWKSRKREQGRQLEASGTPGC